MLNFLRSCGVYAWPLSALTAAIALLTLKKCIDYYGRKSLSPFELERGLHAILFWGIVAAVLGLLGSFTGIYNAMSVIVRASAISPRMVMLGFQESLTTTLFGLVLLLASSIAWFFLYRRFRGLLVGRQKRPAE